MKLKEALGLIPDTDVAQRALELVVKNNLDVDVPDSATALERGFLFPVTSEGAPYWQSVVAALRAGGDIPPLPNKPVPVTRRVETTDTQVVGRITRPLTQLLNPPLPAVMPELEEPQLPPYPDAPDGKRWVFVGRGVRRLFHYATVFADEPRRRGRRWEVGHGSSTGSRDIYYLASVSLTADITRDPCPAGMEWVLVGRDIEGLPEDRTLRLGSNVYFCVPQLSSSALQTSPPSPHASLPPYPDAPDGKVWVYAGEAVSGLRGAGTWASCKLADGETPYWHVCNCNIASSGFPDYHYLQLVDAPTQCTAQCAETCTPNPESGDIAQETAQTPPYPPVPDGYDRWVDRGYGYNSDGVEVRCALLHNGQQEWVVWDGNTCAIGNPRAWYLEAVKDVPVPLQLRVGGYYRQRGGSTCCITTEREGALYCFSDGDGYGYTSSGSYIEDHICHDLDIMEEVPAPALQLRVGGYYRRRDGKVVGPATTYDHPEYTIALATCIYPLNGVHVCPRFDIIEEITQEQYNQEQYNQER